LKYAHCIGKNSLQDWFYHHFATRLRCTYLCWFIWLVWLFGLVWFDSSLWPQFFIYLILILYITSFVCLIASLYWLLCLIYYLSIGSSVWLFFSILTGGQHRRYDNPKWLTTALQLMTFTAIRWWVAER